MLKSFQHAFQFAIIRCLSFFKADSFLSSKEVWFNEEKNEGLWLESPPEELKVMRGHAQNHVADNYLCRCKTEDVIFDQLDFLRIEPVETITVITQNQGITGVVKHLPVLALCSSETL